MQNSTDTHCIGGGSILSVSY